MGYANTNILVYGIKIEEPIAKKIFDYFGGDIEEFDDNMAKIVPESEIVKEPHVTPSGYTFFTNRFHPDLLSIDTDSRCHCLSYEKGYDHLFGLNIAENGYGADDDISEFIRDKKVAKKAKSMFEKYLVPFLTKMDVKEIKGRFHIINQVH